jgi:hypothetical protein
MTPRTRGRFDRAVAAVAAAAALVAAGGAVWAAITATNAWHEAQTQTGIARQEAAASNLAALAEERTARIESEAALIVQCPIGKPAFVDGLWRFDDNANYFLDGRRPTPTSDVYWTCGITNYGRVPALLVSPHFSFIRMKHGFCDLLQSYRQIGMAATEDRLRHFGDLSILGIAAGATYTFAIEIDTNDAFSIFMPNSASYQTPAEAQPTDRPLLGRGPNVNRSIGSVFLPSGNLALRDASFECMRHP